MLTSKRRPPLETISSNESEGGERNNLHNREDLEEVVFRKVLVRVVRVEGPEVVDVEVENAENEHKHDRRELGLETNNDHDAGDESEQAGNDSPETPVTAENEAHKEEDEQDTARKLEVHLLVLLVESRQTGRGELLADPRVGEHHKKPSHDRQIAQEEVEVEHQAVSNALQNHDAHKTSYSVFGVFPCDDHDRGAGHDDYVDNEEEVGDAVPNCERK
jgi:hypothetical protein